MNDDVSGLSGSSADAPLDDTDVALLAQVAIMLDVADPVPDDLVERIQFSLALDEVFAEVAEMTRVLDDALAVRTDLSDATRTETVTFSAERLTAMVTLSELGAGRVRIDGWVTPAGVRTVALRMQGEDQSVRTDESGRFVAEDLRAGFVQLVFHPLEGEDAGLVVTPLFKL
ncbi:MAG TPA: hypothetical protein VFY86_05860 [Nocardioides sp.]|jgi:hypothetical protein|nr:hypothetical protein [uncultured Nocardioides sp.]HEX5986025.1 hypothetical protein [Nocardioides sp.]